MPTDANKDSPRRQLDKGYGKMAEVGTKVSLLRRSSENNDSRFANIAVFHQG